MSNKPYSNLKCPNCQNKGDFISEDEEVYCEHCGLLIQTSYHYTGGIRFKTLTEILDDVRYERFLNRRRRRENERIKKFQKI